MGNAHGAVERPYPSEQYEQWTRTYPATPRSWHSKDQFSYDHYFPEFKSPPRYEQQPDAHFHATQNRGHSTEGAQQIPKVKVLPTRVSEQPKLRSTENGAALHEAGTIVNRKVSHYYDYNTRTIVNTEQPTTQATYSPEMDRARRKEHDESSDPSQTRSKGRNLQDSLSEEEARGRRSRSESRKNPRKLKLFKTRSSSKTRHDDLQKHYAGSTEYLKPDIASETRELRGSCDDLGSVVLGTGPVTVFSSQCNTSQDPDPWSEPETGQQKILPPRDPEFQREIREMVQKKESFLRKTKPVVEKQKQFYYGMTEEDLAVTTSPKKTADMPQVKRREQTNEAVKKNEKCDEMDEYTRKVMEELDSVFVDTRPTGHVSRYEKERGRGRTRRSPPPPAPPSPVTKKKEQRKLCRSTDELDEFDGNINLNLRPTIPKKATQLPRFSPSAAWKSLGISSDERSAKQKGLRDTSFSTSATSQPCQQSSRGSELSEDDDVFEFRISKDARPVAPNRGVNEKSADSGISGSPDASREKPLAMSSPVAVHSGVNWTPQQDLGESSSEESRLEQRSSHTPKLGRNTPPKFTSKSQMFASTAGENQSSSSSVSKGRGRRFRKKKDDTMNESGDSNSSAPYKYNSLRKLKRSVSGAFAAVALRSRSKSPDVRSVTDSNWMLSRSAPNSILNGLDPSRRGSKYKSEADLTREPIGYIPLVSQFPAHSQPILSHRVVYLPQYDSKMRSSQTELSAVGAQRAPMLLDSHLAVKHVTKKQAKNLYFAERMKKAKSADTVYFQQQCITPAASMWDLPPHLTSTPKSPGLLMKHTAPLRKFTFQSTTRLQEKQAAANKLAKEAEEKERRRLQEIELMRRVEEDFQRKRNGEKANIREQLHMHRVLESKNRGRQDPDGAPAALQSQKSHIDQRVREQVPLKAPERNMRHPQFTDYQKNLSEAASPKTKDGNKAKELPKSKELKNNSRITTHELSEFREQRREYRDFHSPRQHLQFHNSSAHSGRLSESSPRSLPSSSSVSDNYRWNFAHGVQGRYKENSRAVKPPWNPNPNRDYRNFLSTSESNSELIRAYRH